jgi:hypothetical protein
MSFIRNIIKSGRTAVLDGLIYAYFKTEEEFDLFLIKKSDFIKSIEGHNGCMSFMSSIRVHNVAKNTPFNFSTIKNLGNMSGEEHVVYYYDKDKHGEFNEKHWYIA